MKPIPIVAKSRNVGQCRLCRATIEWARVHPTGRWMPFDPPVRLVPSAIEAPEIVQVDTDRTTSHLDTCRQSMRRPWRQFR